MKNQVSRSLACALSAFPLLLALGLLAGCASNTCLEGDTTCDMSSPCEAVSFSCEEGSVSVRVLQAGEEAPGGLTALAAPGDIVLSNDRVTVVIDALEHPHYLAPTGGGIVDMSTAGADNDSMRHTFQATGVLPDEAAAYTDMRIIEGEGLVAVQFTGTLDGRPDMPIATRYEMRPCEPGVRVRTELGNGEPDAAAIMLSDGYYFGDRELLPFTPTVGRGFEQPSFGLSNIADVLVQSPYLVTAGHSEPAASYLAVSCSEPLITGFQSLEVAANGLSRKVVMPRDYVVYERFIGASDGSAVAGAADIALELRRQLWGEAYITLSGRLVTESGDPVSGDGLRAAVLISAGTLAYEREDRVPWTQTFPDDEGNWSARVPVGRSYVLEVEGFGREQASFEAVIDESDLDVGELVIPEVGELTLTASLDGLEEHVLAFVLPADDSTEDAVAGQMFANFDTCAPLLGHPHGASPACNRVLIHGETTVQILPGTYDVFASAGPFSTLAAARGVVITAGETTTAELSIARLPLQQGDQVSADFHVHGGASFDSNFPHEDRVKSFLAADIDVIAATDHDAAWDYAASMNDLDAHDRLTLMVGTENTGHILFKLTEDSPFPKVVGHWNIWPLTYDPDGPYGGAAWDEKAEPATLFQRAADLGWDAATGVVQLNHPIGGISFGRDYSWGSALELNLLEDLKPEFDGSLQSLFHHSPEGTEFSNSDFHAQEVMNGTNNGSFLKYRSFWHYLLNQGVLRAGTANSDTHSLAENVVGTPRNLVDYGPSGEVFDEVAFNNAVKDGRMTGTNGPVLEVFVADGENTHRPSLSPFTPGTDAVLRVRIKAAPWVPVNEVRVIVNGDVVRTISEGFSDAADPFGQDGLERIDLTLPLNDLLPASGDSWLSVEAGVPLEPNADLNCDGIPDTGDNNGDGAIDWQDVEDEEATAPTEDEPCMSVVGPLKEPDAPQDRNSALYLYRTVVPGGYPTAFSNPLVIDRAGDGFEAPGVTR